MYSLLLKYYSDIAFVEVSTLFANAVFYAPSIFFFFFTENTIFFCFDTIKLEKEKCTHTHTCEHIKKKTLSTQFIYSLIRYPLKMDFSYIFAAKKKLCIVLCFFRIRIFYFVPFVDCTFDKTEWEAKEEKTWLKSSLKKVLASVLRQMFWLSYKYTHTRTENCIKYAWVNRIQPFLSSMLLLYYFTPFLLRIFRFEMIALQRD